MKLALDVWYDAWSRAGATGAGDLGETLAAEALHDGTHRDDGCRRGADAGGDPGQSPRVS